MSDFIHQYCWHILVGAAILGLIMGPLVVLCVSSHFIATTLANLLLGAVIGATVASVASYGLMALIGSGSPAGFSDKSKRMSIISVEMPDGRPPTFVVWIEGDRETVHGYDQLKARIGNYPNSILGCDTSVPELVRLRIRDLAVDADVRYDDGSNLAVD